MHGKPLDHYTENLKPRDYYYDRRSGQEHMSEEFFRHLEALNNIVIKSGNRFEGSNFYWHETKLSPGLAPEPQLAGGRRNVWRATRFKWSMFEIGVNAGHTALLALMSNPELRYVGVDICMNPYVAECAQYLVDAFPTRVRFIPGDSREILPTLVNSPLRGTFDLLHVDGGHLEGICRADMHNTLLLAGDTQAHLLLDDINAEWIYDIYCEFLMNGFLQTENLLGDWEMDLNRNVLARITKPVSLGK